MLLGWVPLRTRAAAWGSASALSFFVFLSLSVSVPCFLVEPLDVSPPLGLCAALVGSRVYNKSEQLDPNSWSTLTLCGLTDTCTQNIESNVQIKLTPCVLSVCCPLKVSFINRSWFCVFFAAESTGSSWKHKTKSETFVCQIHDMKESFEKADIGSLWYSAAVRHSEF